MKRGRLRQEDLLLTEAIDILMKNLGPIDTNRFLGLAVSRRVESVERHRRWQGMLDKDQFFRDVFGKS